MASSVRRLTALWVSCHTTAKIRAWVASTTYLEPPGGRFTSTPGVRTTKRTTMYARRTAFILLQVTLILGEDRLNKS